MGYIILAVLVAVISIVGIICIKGDTGKSVSTIIFMVDFVVAVFVIANLHMSKSEIDRTVETYYNLKNQVNIINSSTDQKLRNAFIPDLQKKVDDMNKIIFDNDHNCNFWLYVFYYEEIGLLKPLKIIY